MNNISKRLKLLLVVSAFSMVIGVAKPGTQTVVVQNGIDKLVNNPNAAQEDLTRALSLIDQEYDRSKGRATSSDFVTAKKYKEQLEKKLDQLKKQQAEAAQEVQVEEQATTEDQAVTKEVVTLEQTLVKEYTDRALEFADRAVDFVQQNPKMVAAGTGLIVAIPTLLVGGYLADKYLNEGKVVSKLKPQDKKRLARLRAALHNARVSTVGGVSNAGRGVANGVSHGYNYAADSCGKMKQRLSSGLSRAFERIENLR